MDITQTESIILAIFIIGVPVIVLMCVGIAMYYYINVSSKEIEEGWISSAIGLFLFCVILPVLLVIGISWLLGVI